jgi:hypothetical protein
MCPNRKKNHDFGNKKGEHVPEQEEESGFR